MSISMETGVCVPSLVWAQRHRNECMLFYSHHNWLQMKALSKCLQSKFSLFVYTSVPTHQALALLAVLHPRVPAAVGEQAILVQALAAQSRVALRAAEQVGVGVVAVADHPAAHHLASLSGRSTNTHITWARLNIEHTRTLKQDHLFDGIIKHACR